MTEEIAFDLGRADGYNGQPPSFNGEWAHFDAYHRGYAEGIDEKAEES